MFILNKFKVNIFMMFKLIRLNLIPLLPFFIAPRAQPLLFHHQLHI